MVNCLNHLQCIKRVSVIFCTTIQCKQIQCKQIITGTSLLCLINYHDEEEEDGIDDNDCYCYVFVRIIFFYLFSRAYG